MNSRQHQSALPRLCASFLGLSALRRGLSDLRRLLVRGLRRLLASSQCFLHVSYQAQLAVLVGPSESE